MGYVSARGGLDAIRAAEKLVRTKRLVSDSNWLEEEQILDKLRLLVDRVMGEAGLWEPQLASKAIRQSEGDATEAVHLLRAYRSTLPRLAYSEATDVDDAQVMRRIVPAFQRVPGNQLLGRSVDYTARFLERTDDADAREEAEKLRGAERGIVEENNPPAEEISPRRLIHLLQDMDMLIDRRRTDDPEPFDITRQHFVTDRESFAVRAKSGSTSTGLPDSANVEGELHGHRTSADRRSRSSAATLGSLGAEGCPVSRSEWL